MWRHHRRHYALPTDRETIALAVNLGHARRMGVGLHELRRLDWNPKDGGSLQRVIVRFVASFECQKILAETGVLYLAWKGLAAEAVKVQQRQGIDTQAFLDAAAGRSFLPPVVPHGTEVSDLMSATIQRILSGRVRAAEALPEAERRVRQITRRP